MKIRVLFTAEIMIDEDVRTVTQNRTLDVEYERYSSYDPWHIEYENIDVRGRTPQEAAANWLAERVKIIGRHL